MAATSMDAQCTECLTPSAELLATRSGDPVCPACASAHYVACGDCKLLVAGDETREADGVAYCTDCFDRMFAVDGVESDADVDALVAEYVQLQAEAKQLDERIGAIKEQLKKIAASRERVAGAVVLGEGDAEVKCSYRTDYKAPDPEKVEALEPLLGHDRFAALFERSVTYKPVKSSLEEFLATADAPLQEAVRDAVRITEIETLTMPRSRKK